MGHAGCSTTSRCKLLYVPIMSALAKGARLLNTGCVQKIYTVDSTPELCTLYQTLECLKKVTSTRYALAKADLKADLKADTCYNRGSCFCLARQMFITGGVSQLRSYPIRHTFVSLETRLCLAIRPCTTGPWGCIFTFFSKSGFR